MGVREQFNARHQRTKPLGGAGFGNFLKNTLKKGMHFIGQEGKKFGSSVLDSAKEYAQNELSDAGKEFVNKTGDKLRKGVTEIVKDSAGPLAESILKNPGATREIVSDHYKNAKEKTKKLVQEAVDDSKSFAGDQVGKAKNKSKIALSEALAKTKTGKRMKGKGATNDGEVSRPATASEVAPHRRKRLLTIVPVGNTQSGQGSQLIGAQYQRGRGIRVIGS